MRCGSDEGACWHQADEACHGSFDLRELHARSGAVEAVNVGVRDGATPTGTAIAGREIVLRCAAPVVPPAVTAGPECLTSVPRPNHCDAADGETFKTGRTYLPPDVTPTAASADANADAALAELQTLADDLGPQIDALRKPVDDVPALLKSLAELPRAYRLKPARVKALAKLAIAGGETTAPRDIREEVADDVTALLIHLKATASGLGAMPTSTTALLTAISAREAKVPALADAASARKGGKDVTQLKAAALKQLEDARMKVSALPAQATQALAKLSSAAS